MSADQARGDDELRGVMPRGCSFAEAVICGVCQRRMQSQWVNQEQLQLRERFFTTTTTTTTTASPTVIAEHHTFLVAEGVHPVAALG